MHAPIRTDANAVLPPSCSLVAATTTSTGAAAAAASALSDRISSTGAPPSTDDEDDLTLAPPTPFPPPPSPSRDAAACTNARRRRRLLRPPPPTPDAYTILPSPPSSPALGGALYSATVTAAVADDPLGCSSGAVYRGEAMAETKRDSIAPCLVKSHRRYLRWRLELVVHTRVRARVRVSVLRICRSLPKGVPVPIQLRYASSKHRPSIPGL